VQHALGSDRDAADEVPYACTSMQQEILRPRPSRGRCWTRTRTDATRARSGARAEKPRQGIDLPPPRNSSIGLGEVPVTKRIILARVRPDCAAIVVKKKVPGASQAFSRRLMP